MARALGIGRRDAAAGSKANCVGRADDVNAYPRPGLSWPVLLHPPLSCPGLTGASSTPRRFGPCLTVSGIPDRPIKSGDDTVVQERVHPSTLPPESKPPRSLAGTRRLVMPW